MLRLAVLLCLGCNDPVVHCYEYSAGFCSCQKGDTSTPGTPVSSCQPGGSGFRRCRAQPGYPNTVGAQCFCEPWCCVAVNTSDYCKCGGCDPSDVPVATCTGFGPIYCQGGGICESKPAGTGCGGDTATSCGPDDAQLPSGYAKIAACL
jgi:hypothetical protein